MKKRKSHTKSVHQHGVWAALIASVLLCTSTSANSQSVVKTGRDLTTQSTTATQAGRTIRYALSLELPAGQAAATVNVTDALPAGLEYVAGSLKLPSNAVGAWSINSGSSYVGVEPSPASSVTNLRVTGSAYMAATSAMGTLPTPPMVSANGNTGGDGYRPIPYNGNVYSLYHHNTGDVLYCGNQATGLVCPGFPTSVPMTAGAPFASGSWYETSLITAEYLDRNTGRLYFWVRDQATSKPAVACADLQAKTSCGAYIFSDAPDISPPSSYFVITGGHSSGRFYANAGGGRMLCFDTGTFAPCAGTNAAGTIAVPSAPADSNYHENEGTYQVGSRLYWQAVSAATSQTTLTCLDMATNAGCAGFVPSIVGESGMFVPTATAAGVSNGFCLARYALTTCYDLTGADVTASKTAFIAYVELNNLPFAGSLPSLGAALLTNGPSVANSRTLWQSVSQKICWDWVSNAPCAGYDPVLGFGGYFYEATIDPAYPTCVWSLGDYGILGATSSIDGGPCKVEVKTQVKAGPAGDYCDGQPHASAWSRIQLVGLSSGDYATAKVTIRDAGGNVLGDWNAKPATFPIDLSSYPVSGATSTLTIDVELEGITNVTPFEVNPKPYVQLVWSGDPQQVCFDAKVACGSVQSPLTNAVTGAISGLSVTGSHTFNTVEQACYVPPVDPPVNPPVTTAVPTLDAKALAGLGLLFAVLGVGGLRNRRTRNA